MYTQGLGCCKGMGSSYLDFPDFGAGAWDTSGNPVDFGGVASAGSDINWNAILPGVFKTAEQIGIMQTTPAGRYVATTPGGGSVVYQQPTSGGVPGLSLPGLTLPTGFSTSTLLLLGAAAIGALLILKK